MPLGNAELRDFRVVLISCMVALLACPAALARDVLFSSENSNPLLHAQLKPYCIAARKQVEAVWDEVDPHNGKEVQLIFSIGANGELVQVFPRELNPNPLTERAVYAVTQCGDFPPLPLGQKVLIVCATFKSKHDFGPTYQKIGDVAVAAALIGLTGLAIYGLMRLSTNSSGGDDAVNANYHWVEAHYTKNGVFVPGHYQTNGNNSLSDNWSTAGNVNPFTGKPGWVQP